MKASLVVVEPENGAVYDHFSIKKKKQTQNYLIELIYGLILKKKHSTKEQQYTHKK